MTKAKEAGELKLGLWAPLPHTIRPEPRMERAIQALQSSGPVAQGGDEAYKMALQMVQRAEELGFATTLVAERLLGPDLESWALASAIAAQTSKIEIIAAVHPGMISPQMAAKMAASLDRISGGRFVINIINGWWKEEFQMFSNGQWLEDSDARYRRMDEYMEVLTLLTSGGPVNFKGEFYKLDQAVVHTRMSRPRVPLYTASRAEAGKQSIARLGDLWFVEYGGDYRDFESTLATVKNDMISMQARAAQYDRKLEFGMSAHVLIAETDEKAEALAAEMAKAALANPVAALPLRALGAGIYGSPKRVAERLNRYREAGLDVAMMHFHPMQDGLEYFAAEVQPLLH